MKKALLTLFALSGLFLTACSTSAFVAKETLRVDSTPSGADVWINGELKGKTPLSVSLESLNIYKVELRRDGFKPAKVDVFSELSQSAKTGFRVNPLVDKGYYSSLSPNPVEVELISTLIPDDANASKGWGEFASRINELDRWLREGKITEQTYRHIQRQLIEFYEN